MKKHIILIISFILLASCGNSQNIENKEPEKQAFYIQTKNISDLGNFSIIEKSGKIIPNSIINLNSQANGQVSKIYVKEGDKVKKGQVLANLSDTITFYNINLASAKNSIERAKLNLKSTEISLNKSISDAKLNLTKSRTNYEIAKKDAEQTIKNAQNNIDKIKIGLENTNLSSGSSISSLDLENARESLKNKENDYQNKLVADQETLNGFISSTKEKYKSLRTSYLDIVNFADELYGVGQSNKYKNSAFKEYLGAKDSISVQNTKNEIQKMLEKKEDILNKDLSNLNENNLLKTVEDLDGTYNELIDLLKDIQHDLNNSVESITFPQSAINQYSQQVSMFQNVVSQKYTMYVGFKTQIKSFLSTYKASQESIAQQIEIAKQNVNIMEKKLQTQSDDLNINYDSAKVGYEKTYLAMQDKVSSLNIALQSAKDNLEIAEKNREITLAQLQNAVDQAQIAYNEIATQAGKLTIKSPINGKISKVNIDLGQDVFSNSALFQIIQDTGIEVQTAFSQKELESIKNGSIVKTNYLGNDLTGYVYSISYLANKNLTYDVKIKFNDDVNIFGDIINLYFPIQTEKLLIPVNIIEVKGEGVGFINILKDGKIGTLEVKVGKIYGDKIEILSDIEPNTIIVETDIEHFDPNKYKLEIQK